MTYTLEDRLGDEEMIMGVYGESYENNNNCLKNFGFIIGKQVRSS